MSPETPYQLAELYDDFFVGNGMDDSKYIVGLIVQTNKGNVATLYARSTANTYGLNRKMLEQVVGVWNLGHKSANVSIHAFAHHLAQSDELLPSIIMSAPKSYLGLRTDHKRQ